MDDADPDQSYLDRIQNLQRETDRICAQIGILNADRVRVQKIAIEIDRLWGVVRQRRASREYGRTFYDEHILAGLVEGYRG